MTLHKFPWYKRYYYAFRLGWHIYHSTEQATRAYYNKLKEKAE